MSGVSYKMLYVIFLHSYYILITVGEVRENREQFESPLLPTLLPRAEVWS
jgi:hypothetical protein